MDLNRLYECDYTSTTYTGTMSSRKLAVANVLRISKPHATYRAPITCPRRILGLIILALALHGAMLELGLQFMS